MYEKFFNFKEKPFNTTPDSKFFYPSEKHNEAMHSLLYAINERKGFVVVTGEIGAGKTTVYRTVLNKLPVNTKVATIVNTHLTPKEIIAELLDELEIEYTGGNKQKLLSKLNHFLIQQLSADINVVLIIDEAQNLTPKALEEVRMLSNLETEKEKLIQIILIGQPQLKAKLENPKLEQFKQRIAVYYHLKPLTRKETEAYIKHRLNLVSQDGAINIFTAEAIDLIYGYSKGTPRIINLICDSALLSGYVYETKRIDAKIVSEVLRERDFNAFTQEEEIEKTEEIKPLIRHSNIKIFCCTDCTRYSTCEIKWNRGLKGEEQLCCEKCPNYNQCQNALETNK